MKRVPDWRSRMHAFIAEVGATPFDWKSFECGVAWAGRHVELMTGADVAAPFRGRFKDEVSALRMIRKAGFADLGELVSSLLEEHLGEDGKPASSRARTGDVAGIATSSKVGMSLGIVSGSRILTVGLRGYETVDLLKADRAWKVGDA